jgi:phage anti-repressor protein
MIFFNNQNKKGVNIKIVNEPLSNNQDEKDQYIYISDGKEFSLLFPNTWGRDLDYYGTLMFYKGEGTGALRITLLKINPENKSLNIHTYIQNKSKKYDNSKIYVKDSQLYLEFSEENFEKNQTVLMNYWFIGKDDYLLIVSFALSKERSDTPESRIELNEAKEIVNSIKIK